VSDFNDINRVTAYRFYYSYVIFVIAYGIAIGAFHYTNKMLVFSQVKTKAFGKAWSYVQCGQSFAILIGIPITG
jgi:predicted MFS family arabinose efflux permease